jgi:spore maturation protein A
MLNKIWFIIIIISFFFALITGNIENLTKSVFDGTGQAISIAISLAGIMCLWNGVMNIATKSGLTDKLCKLLSPLLKILFPSTPPDSEAGKSIAMNITANFLGIGNAATPSGIAAIKSMSKNVSKIGTATNDMITFMVMNTAAFQLIPTTIAALRIRYGARNPLDVMPAMWITSICALTVGITISKIIGREKKNV